MSLKWRREVSYIDLPSDEFYIQIQHAVVFAAGDKKNRVNFLSSSIYTFFSVGKVLFKYRCVKLQIFFGSLFKAVFHVFTFSANDSCHSALTTRLWVVKSLVICSCLRSRRSLITFLLVIKWS